MKLSTIFSSDAFNRAADLCKRDFLNLQEKITKAGSDIYHLKDLESYGLAALTLDDKKSSISRICKNRHRFWLLMNKGMTDEDILVERCEQLDDIIKKDIKACVDAIIAMNNAYCTLTGEGFLELKDADKQLTHQFEQLYIAA